MNKFPFMVAMREVFEEKLFTLTPQKEQAVVNQFMEWFNKDARLKAAPDLQQRIVDMEPKLRKMAKNLKVTFREGKLVIKSDADSETLLSLLRRGTDWFDPHPDVNAAILMAMTTGSQIS